MVGDGVERIVMVEENRSKTKRDIFKFLVFIWLSLQGSNCEKDRLELLQG